MLKPVVDVEAHERAWIRMDYAQRHRPRRVALLDRPGVVGFLARHGLFIAVGAVLILYALF